MRPALRPDDRRETIALLSELRRRERLAPLAYARLWHNRRPRTSQLRAVAADASLRDGKRPRLTMILGGNRTGKSEAMAMWGIAQAAGLDAYIETPNGRFEWVRQWLAINGLPEDLVPRGPGRVWAGSPAFGMSRETIRPKLERYAPEGTRFVCWQQPQEAEMRLPNGAVIVSKAYRQFDQDPQTWEGAAIRALLLDEQPNSYRNLAAGLARLIDVNGRAMMALTPLRGKADWLYQDVVRKAPSWLRIAKLFGGDNPHISQEARAEILLMFPEWQRAARDFGDFVDPSGRIYTFARDVHTVQPFVPPGHWTRFQAFDWGTRNAHVIWAAQVAEQFTLLSGRTLHTGDLVVYRELAYRRKLHEIPMDAGRLVDVALELERNCVEDTCGLAPVYRVADPAEPDALTAARERGLIVTEAPKERGSVLSGIQDVECLLRSYDPVTSLAVRPRLYVTEDCPVLIEEMEGLRYAEPRPGHPAEPDPLCPDHGPDTLRYLVRHRQHLGLAA